MISKYIIKTETWSSMEMVWLEQFGYHEATFNQDTGKSKKHKCVDSH